jgi:carbon-monoxide dehydrogenase large subunit
MRASRAVVAFPLVTKVSLTMNAPFDPSLQLTEKFAVGQPVSRKEDPVLLRGEGRYSDDLNRDGQLYGVMVRSSRVAHGILRSIDSEEARGMPACAR